MLINEVRTGEMPREGTQIYAVAGAEYAAFKDIRRYWREELKLCAKDVFPVAYWRRGKAEAEATDDDEN